MLNRIVPSRYDAPTLPASFLRPKSYATDAMSMPLSGKEISSRATALPSGKGGAYGLVHPDGSKCDAKTPDTCRKFPHKDMEMANPQAKGGETGENAENTPMENKGGNENPASKPTENGSQSASTNPKPTNPNPAPKPQETDTDADKALSMTDEQIEAFIQDSAKTYSKEELSAIDLPNILQGKGYLNLKNGLVAIRNAIAKAPTATEKRRLARRFFAVLSKSNVEFAKQVGTAIDTAKAVAKKAKELESKITEPTVSGVLSENQKQKCLDETKRINQGFKDAGIETFVSEVERNPFETKLVFKHDGPLSPKEREALASKLGVKADVIPSSPIEGRPDTFAITIPHEKIEDVAFSDMMKDKKVNDAAAGMKAPIALGVGKDGKSVVHSLAKMVHLLIGGSTGTGKSSVLNSILTSLLKWSSPDDTELYLIDPKGTELSAYKDMPHVKQSILGNDPGAVVKMLDESIAEMRNRNEFFASLKKTHGAIIKDLDGYNNYRKMHPELNLPPMKRRVICIEEAANFAKDAKTKKEVFSRIALLAEQSRSAGMNLIVTTQDPKVETVGDIKANFPSRIALKTADEVKSRSILDEGGAENLTGRGDMLVKTDEGMERVKGAFINDKQETAGEPSELDKELETVKEKYPKPEPEPAPEPAPAPEPKPSEGGEGGEGDGAGGGEPPKPTPEPPKPTPEPPSGGKEPSGGESGGKEPPKPEPPKPEGGENGGEDDNGEKPTLPNSHGPVDISHLGFFKAIKAAVVYGANGQSITYDPAAYNRMGAEKWKKHLAEVRGEGKEPDYSTHRLNEIYPLSPKASNTQKEMFKKWCAKFNSACENPDPMVAHRVKKQYLAWLKDEGLTDNPDDGTAPHTNPYIDALNKGKTSSGGDGGSTGGSAASA